MLHFRLTCRTAGLILFICLFGGILLASCSQTATIVSTSQPPALPSNEAATTASVPVSHAGAAPASLPVSPSATPVSTPVGYFVAIMINGKMAAALSRADLEKLDQVTVTAGNSPQHGPTLFSVLQRAGITDFNELTAYGMSRGRLASAELTLKRDQMDSTIVLDLNNRGKCKLCGVNIPQNNWVIDLAKLEVK
jgi:hypothetical protein